MPTCMKEAECMHCQSPLPRQTTVASDRMCSFQRTGVKARGDLSTKGHLVRIYVVLPVNSLLLCAR